MGFKKWIFRENDKQQAMLLAEECDADPLVALIAYGRGCRDAASLDELLSEEPVFSDYRLLKDIDKAAEAVNSALNDGQKIAVYGDYDCDGVTATALLYKFLRDMGGNVIYYIPDRHSEGYGMNMASLNELKENGVGLIITVDNGIAAIDEIARAKELGINVVVSDHHLPKEQLPDALAVVDPQLKDDGFPFKGLSGVGVAFYLACAICGAEPEELIERYAELVMIGTVADVMPLTHDNRAFVKEGLKKLTENPGPGLSELMAAAGCDKKTISAGMVSFVLAPRINAAGRMEKAVKSLELLLTDDRQTAQSLAAVLCEDNSKRQQTEAKIAEEAVELVIGRGYEYDRVIVAAKEGWHDGVIGIAASRLCSLFGKPVILLSIEDGVAKGSGRSIGGFSLFNAIKNASGRLVKFGGHDMAAGVTLKADDIDEFRNDINEYARTLPRPVEQITLDCRLNPAAVDCELADALRVLAPFGEGNPTPVFGFMNMKIERITPVGAGKHLRLSLCKNGAVLNVMLFSVERDDFGFSEGDLIDVAVTIESGEWRGQRQLNITARDVRAAGINEEDKIKSLELYDKYKKDALGAGEAALLLPDRDEIVLVYKKIGSGSKAVKIKGELADILDAKIDVALEVLCEIGVVTLEGRAESRSVSPVPGVKSDLNRSVILKKLKERSGFND